MVKRNLTYKEYEKRVKARFFAVMSNIMTNKATPGARFNMLSRLEYDESLPSTNFCKSLTADIVKWFEHEQKKHVELQAYHIGFEIREVKTRGGIPIGKATIMMWFSKEHSS